MIPYDPAFPADWYWRDDAGRVYSSARQAIVAETDETYLAWAAAGSAPTRWPQDAAGDQTSAALQAVLSPYGLWVDLVAYAADKRWRVENGGIVAAGVPLETDDRAKLMIMGSRLAAMTDPLWSTVWDGADGGSYPVDATAMVAISDAVQAHVSAAFAVYATVRAGIEAGTITTIAEIDAAGWPGAGED